MPSYRLKLYPRGFLGAMLGVRAERRMALRENNRGFQTAEVRELKNQNSFDAPNPDVEALYDTYQSQQGVSGAFEFRRDVLLTALAAFGTTTFEAWFEAQFKNPSAGDLHGRFLVDTLKFISEGRREMRLETWASLISIVSAGGHIGPFPAAAKEFFGIGRQYRESFSLTEIIQRWCSQPGGFEDMLGTLHILFGRPDV